MGHGSSSLVGNNYNVLAAATLTNALSQNATNGNSVLGTLKAPTMPKFLTNNPLINGTPWGDNHSVQNNPNNAPSTGVTRKYDFTVSRGQISPDGFLKPSILINGGFPGPLIEANWGDTITVTLHNNITGPEEGTALHWHGLLQKGTGYMDGVPGVSQCPVAPGKSFTYSFSAAVYGTTWYHSHYSAQYSDGVVGPLIIHGPTNAQYDVDLGPVILSDYFHTGYDKILESVLATGAKANPAPKSDNNLINGKGNFSCSALASNVTNPCVNNAGLSKFTFSPGKTYRLRLINTGSEGMQRFSIDNHQMTVFANDLVEIVPYTTKVVTLGVGQRSDVLVTANQASAGSAFWMRSNISTICSLTNQPFGLAAIYYEGASTTAAPTSKAWDIPDPGTCGNDPLEQTVPSYSIDAVAPATTKVMNIGLFQNATGHTLWTFANVSARVNYNEPVLLAVDQGNTNFGVEDNVLNFGTNTSIRFVVNNLSPAAHPMHLHGHDFQVIGEGNGTWDGTTLTNLANPQRRDVQIVVPDGYIVVQILADNPGAWPFHCHISWHVSGGLYATILENPATVAASGNGIPQTLPQTCTDWTAYTAKNVVDEIDSGV